MFWTVFRRFFQREVFDPITGRTFPKDLWQLELQSRTLVVGFRKFGGMAWTEVALDGVPDPDHSISRGHIALWLVEQWAYEHFGYDPDDLTEPHTPGPGAEYADLFAEHMNDQEVFLLLNSIPDEPLSPKLPEIKSTATAIRAIPQDEDSYERHRWRFEIRNKGLLDGKERLATAYEPGDGTPIEDWVVQFYAEVDEELDAGYCGFKDCRHCSDPAPGQDLLSPEVVEVIDGLSPLAQTMVLLDREHEAAWGRLFADVGRNKAIELTEVTAADSWARMMPETTAAVLRRWADRELNESAAIEELDRIEQTARTVLSDAEERVSEDPTYEESRVVLWAAGNLYDHWFPAANAYVKNEPADTLAATAQEAKDRLEHESEQFDRATGRLSMPFIGDPRHWDRD
jgi:hypothetical protein